MKHNFKITAILLVMFLVTQIIGLAIVSYYGSDSNELPYGLEPPEVTEETAGSFLVSLIFAFIIAIFLVFILMNIKSVWIMRIWFFTVITLALGITINATGNYLNVPYIYYIALGASLILAYIKVFRKNMWVHNISELLIYPGIAAIFVPVLNMWTIILLLIIISAYDIWAVWHSGIMQKMAKFQIEKLGVFSGFFVPYADKKMRNKIKLLKLKYKTKKDIPDSVIKRQKIKVNLAILGGGDVIFPIIAAGVFLKTTQNIWATLLVTLGASIALLYLFLFAKKRKFYPAMPYISTGIFAGMILGWLVTLI